MPGMVIGVGMPNVMTKIDIMLLWGRYEENMDLYLVYDVAVRYSFQS